MSKEINKTELSEQELDQVAGGGTTVKSSKSNSSEAPVIPVPAPPLKR